MQAEKFILPDPWYVSGSEGSVLLVAQAGGSTFCHGDAFLKSTGGKTGEVEETANSKHSNIRKRSTVQSS